MLTRYLLVAFSLAACGPVERHDPLPMEETFSLPEPSSRRVWSSEFFHCGTEGDFENPVEVTSDFLQETETAASAIMRCMHDAFDARAAARFDSFSESVFGHPMYEVNLFVPYEDFRGWEFWSFRQPVERLGDVIRPYQFEQISHAFHDPFYPDERSRVLKYSTIVIRCSLARQAAKANTPTD